MPIVAVMLLPKATLLVLLRPQNWGSIAEASGKLQANMQSAASRAAVAAIHFSGTARDGVRCSGLERVQDSPVACCARQCTC
jgi:hypothetical protein